MSDSSSSHGKTFFHKLVRNEQTNARRAIVEELFNDMYRDRHKIYVMNFFRGIFFGLGSAIGGTIVLAFIVWIFSLFVNIPLIGQSFQQAQDSIHTDQSR
jgi:hypothetical protein